MKLTVDRTGNVAGRMKEERAAARAALAQPENERVTYELLDYWQQKMDKNRKAWDILPSPEGDGYLFAYGERLVLTKEEAEHAAIAAEVAPYLVREIIRLREIVRRGC